MAILVGGPVLAALALAAGTVAVGAVARSEYAELERSCDIGSVTARQLGATSYVYAGDDTYLGAIDAEVHRQPVPLAEVSPWVQQATVAIEDRRFWEHDGLDYQGIVRAALKNARAGGIVEGGSTITQQLVRSLYLTRQVSWERKRHEACLALALEGRWTKERILNGYLNRIYYGNTAYGIEAAAQTYFSRRASELGPAQAALLAGLPQAPSAYDPFRNPEAALARRNAVLDAMAATGAMPPEAAEKAKALPLNLRRGNLFDTRRAPYFFDFVRRQLVEAYGERVVRRGGLRVYTTVIPRYQRLAREAVREELGRPDDPAAAIVAVDPRNGAIRAMASVVPRADPDFNLAFQGRRQAGSAFKTFVLVESMRQGANPATSYYASAPFSYDPGPGQKLWEPKTYSGTYYGPSSILRATLRSDNVVFARLTLDVGPRRVAELARRMGVHSPLKPVPSIGLGSNSVSVLDMASAYSTLAARGLRREPYAIRKVVLPTGEQDALNWGGGEPERILSDGIAHRATQILALNVEGGTGTRAQLGRPAAGKTGTTDDHTDAWFVGYTPQLTTAVWVGYPNRTVPMERVHGIRVTGGSFPAAIWRRFMSGALARAPVERWRKPETPVHWEPWRGERSMNPQKADDLEAES